MTMGNDLKYCVCRGSSDFAPVADWNDARWQHVPSAAIDKYVWDEGRFKPDAHVKLQYTDEHLYVVFRVQDRYVRCVETRYCGKVYEDSCVEFFFSPVPDQPAPYFNIEANCGGTVLFRHQTGLLVNTRQVEEGDSRLLQIAHTMPTTVDPELADPVTWVLAYRIPFAVLEKYAKVVRPGPGVAWRGNFYKCAETNSHPHWGSWAPIVRPKPDFHRPEFFAPIVFE
jgi:hypothetical protein